MSLIDDIRKDREAGTPGRWKSPYETWDHGWELQTPCDNTYQGVGPECADDSKTPIAIIGVNSAFGKDHILEANARRIARVPDLEAAYISAVEEIAELKAIIARIDEVTPRADSTCDDPGITLSEAVRRERAAIGESQ